jgi:putative ABC transport system permease protein
MRQDFLFAWRQLRRSARFAVLAVATLALGIGASTAIFSLVRGVLLKALPFPEPERVVALHTMQFPPGNGMGSAAGAGSPVDNSYPDFLDWREQSKSFEAIATYTYGTTRNYTPSGNGRSRVIHGVHVSSDFFQTLGVMPQYGRPFRREDENEGTRAVIISHDFWMSEFNGSPSAIGGPIRLSDKIDTIVGVMPAGFRFPYLTDTTQFWDTYGVLKPWFLDLNLRGERSTNVVARLRSGVTRAQAESEISVMQRRFAESYSEDRNYSAVQVTSLLDGVTGDYRKQLFLLFGAVCGVWLIACVNAAGLLVARGVMRREEFAVRTALGASRAQIIRQVLIESTILSIAAGIAGVGLAILLLKGFLAVVPVDLPRVEEVGIDWATLGFAVGVCLLTGISCGVLPAWVASRSDGMLALGRGRKTSGGKREQQIHNGLAVAEIAISLVLLAGSGLLIRSFLETMRVNPGFDPHGLLSFRLGMTAVQYPHEKALQFLAEARDALAELPGVQSVTSAYPMPFTYDDVQKFQREGEAYDKSNPLEANLITIEPHYFETMKIPLLSGRSIEAHDTAKSKRVAVVDAEFAREFFPKGDAIGKSIAPDWGRNAPPDWYEIVGIVGSIRNRDLTQDPAPQFYLRPEQAEDWPEGLIVRTQGDPRKYIGAISAAVWKLDPGLPVFDVSTVDERVKQSTAMTRFEAQLLTWFAVAALLLAAVGLYATLSEMVARRTFEIGLRVALGAQPGDVFRLVLWKGLLMAGIGVAAGLAGFWAVSRVFADLVYGVAPYDPTTVFVAGLVLVGVAIAASAWPAWRAVRLEPMKALREQ